MTDREQQIEQINLKIVALILERKQAQRRGTWAQEEAIYKQIAELESQIKQIEAGQ